MKALNWLAILLTLCLLASFAFVACGDDDDDDNDSGSPADDDADDDAGDDDDVDDDTDDDVDDDIPETTEGFVYAPAGMFTMGSPAEEPGHRENEEQHDVTLTNHFEILASEVTQGMFEEVMGYNPSYFNAFGHAPNKPVEQVSWYDALAFANKLSERHGLDTCYTLTDIVCANDDPGDTADYCMNNGGVKGADIALNGVDSQYDCDGFRLPTEAEWEYAARAGTTSAHYGGDVLEIGCTPLDANLHPIAWYCGNAALETHPVKTRMPNDWGLYDMIGNLMEWTGDDYHTDTGPDATDPEEFIDAYYRTVRGTAMRFHSPRRARAAYRAAYTPKFRERWIGFRVVRTLLSNAEKRMPAYDFRVPHSGRKVDPGPTLRDLPDSLPFTFTRTDVGTPLTAPEIDEFTAKITGLWKDIDYFQWLNRITHGMDKTNPGGYPPFGLYWQDVSSVKSGTTVTFEHHGNADNLMIPTGKIFNTVAAIYLETGDAEYARLVELYCQGIVALIRGLLFNEEDPDIYLMARAIFPSDHAYSHDDRDAAVTYGGSKQYVYDWNAHTVPNPDNPDYGDIWVRNWRSQDDVPHIFRMVPMVQRVIDEATDETVLAAAENALEYLQGFTRDIVDSGYNIRSREEGDVHVPLMESGFRIADLASFSAYDPILPNTQCDAKLTAALISYSDPLDNDCGNGLGGLYELIATTGNYYTHMIIRYFHIAAIYNALMWGHDDLALTLLQGLAERTNDSMYDMSLPGRDHDAWSADVAAYLLAAGAAGLPLTSDEARLIVEEYSKAASHYETWPYWDLWDGSLGDGSYAYSPGENGAFGRVIRDEEIAMLIEYCWSPFRNPASAVVVDCDAILDPTRWGD
jgi:formylglycine-generating enzyme required for sulfatase activity